VLCLVKVDVATRVFVVRTVCVALCDRDLDNDSEGDGDRDCVVVLEIVVRTVLVVVLENVADIEIVEESVEVRVGE
jgi:hypothetical protein